MIPIKRNHFYTKEIISNAVGVYPQFKDLCVGAAETTLEFKGGLGAVQYVVSGNVSETPRQGTSELVGGFFQTYVTGMSISGTSTLPKLFAYKLQNDFPIAEGGLSLASGTLELESGSSGTEGLIGDKFWFSSSQLATDDIWLEENFDGSNKSMGAKLVLPGGGNAILTLSDAYISPKLGAEAIYFGGDAFFGGGELDNVELNLSRYFSQPSTTGGLTSFRVYVRPVKKNNIKGLWTTTFDNRNDKQKWQIYTPYWKWDKIRPILLFGSKTTGEEAGDPDAQQEASQENTVFNKLYKDPASGAPYAFSLGGGSQFGADIITTTMKLMPSEGTGIGQSLEIKNAWGVSNNDGPSNRYGVEAHGGAAMLFYSGVPGPPVQSSWASMYDIPYPLANNVGGLGQTLTESGTMGGGDQRVAFPEINISMKINSLLPAPALYTTDPEVAGDLVWAYGTTAGGNDSGDTSSYDHDDATYVLPHNKTFWRSVVVTFSNYKPAPAETFDSFLLRGLNTAYGKDQPDEAVEGAGAFVSTKNIGPKVVTGIVFSRFYGGQSGGDRADSWATGYYDRNAIYAYSLPMCAPLSGSGLNNGIAGLIATTGGNDDTIFNPGPTVLHRPEFGALSGSARTGYPYVKLPKGEFFNMRFIFDVQQPWSKETGYGWWAQENDERYGPNLSTGAGVPIRAYFTTTEPLIVPAKTTWTDGIIVTTDAVEADERVVPYLNLSLPVEAAAGVMGQQYMSNITKSGTDMTRQTDRSTVAGSPRNFPRIMTIWVNNFGMAPGIGATPHFWAGNNKWFDSNYWCSDDVGFPIKTSSGTVAGGQGVGSWTGPSSINTTLYIDSIEFKYWNSPITNMSTAASQFSRPMVTLQTTVPSPAVQSPTTSGYYTKAFAANGYLNELAPGQNFTIGYKNWDWLPVVDAADAGGGSYGAHSGYMLFNNFNSKQFGLLERNSPTAAWISSLESSGDAHNLFPGYEMYGNIVQEVADLEEKAPEYTRSKVFVTTGSTDDPDDEFPTTGANPNYSENAYICCGFEGAGNWLSNDGLTQKGFMKFTMSSGNSASHYDSTVSRDCYTVARENVLTSAKIVSIAGSPPADGTEEDEPAKNAIKVDNIEVFQEDLDDEYIIYRAGESLFNEGAITATGALNPLTDTTCDITENSATVKWDGTGTTALQIGYSVYQTTTQTDEADAGIRPNSFIQKVYEAGGLEYFIMNKEATGTTDNNYELSFGIAARNALGYKQTIKMVEKDIMNSTVLLKVLDSSGDEISTGIELADDNVTKLCSPGNLFQLYISPKRIWMNMMYMNDGWEVPRQYENICMVGETPATGSISTQLGTTYNEASYTYNTANIAVKGMAAVLEKPWILGLYPDSALITSQDYGFGSYDEEKNEGGQAGISVPILNTQSYIDISGLVKAVSPGSGEEVSLVLGLTDQVTTKVVTIVGDDTSLDTGGTTYYRPQYVWEYHDPMPSVKEFKVAPQFDLLEPDVNLYEFTKEPINNLKFTWEEDGDDIWYRHLIIDASGAVDNKYHRANIWIPFNEYGTTWTLSGAGNGVTSTSAYTGPYSFYQEDRDPSKTTVGFTSGNIYSLGYGNVADAEFGQITPTVDGISGYAPWLGGAFGDGLHTSHAGPNRLFVGSWEIKGASVTLFDYELEQSLGSYAADKGALGGGNPWTEEWSLVIHCNPSGAQAFKYNEGNSGMTVCGIQANQNGFRTLDDAAAVTITAGNRDIDGTVGPTGGGAGSLTWTGDSGSAATPKGGFDLLHVFLKEGHVCVQYNHEYSGSFAGSNVTSNKALTTGAYEAVALASGRTFPMNGTTPLSILITFNKKRGTTDSSAATTDVISKDEFRLYVNGKLEDSESMKYSSDFYQLANSTSYPPLGGFGRTNYNKFIIGCFNSFTTTEEWNVLDGGSFPSVDADYGWGGPPTKACNITAACGGGADGATFVTRYNQDEQRYIGTIEEIILYPYEIYNVESATEYITDTRGFRDYVPDGDFELNYNARLFVFDYTNVRGKSPSQVASSNSVQWKVTGV